MSGETPQALLAEAQICVLATISPDGSAHAMPMWYAYENGELFFMTGPASRKYKNVERTGKATVTLDRRTPPYYAIMVKGDARVGGKLGYEQRLRIVTRYLGASAARKYLQPDAGDGGSIIVTPTKIVEFNGKAGR